MDTPDKRPPMSSYLSLNQLELSKETDSPPSSQSENLSESLGYISGATTDIVLGLVYILVPSLVLSSLLIGLVIGNRVRTNQSEDEPLSFTQVAHGSSAYYVDYNATSLATIASWTSTIGPLIAFSIMSLASFPIARKLQDNSRDGSSDLPTPFQLSMLFQTLNAKLSSFWTLFLYRKWNHKERFPSMLRTAFYLLVLILLLGSIVATIDTWFHLAMTSVNIDFVSLRKPSESLGRGIADAACAKQQSSEFDTRDCTVKVTDSALGLSNWLIGANEAYWAITNLSTINTVKTMNMNGSTFAYLAPAIIPEGLDYQAHAMAVSTQCQPVGSDCNLHVNDNGAEPFKCSQGFNGDLSVPQINGSLATSGSFSSRTGVIFYEDPELNTNASFQNHVQNPYHLGVWAVLQLEPFAPQLKDGNVVQTAQGGTSWLLNCTTTVHDFSYSWIKGAVRDANATISNGTMAALMNSPVWYGFGGSTMEDIAYAASAENDTQALADSWARGYSKTIIGLSAGFMSARPNILEQERRSMLVARVPKAPFFFLIALNYVYVILAGILAYCAIMSRPNETNDVRERLTISGLMAYAFEGNRARKAVSQKKHLFAEHDKEDPGRIALERSEFGGWEYMRR